MLCLQIRFKIVLLRQFGLLSEVFGLGSLDVDNRKRR
jgi:hypothetical protein